MGQLQQFQLLAPPCPHPSPAFLLALSKSSSGWGWDRVAAHATEGVAKLPAPRGPKLPSCPWSDRSPGTGGQGVDVCEGGLGPPGALCRLLPRVPFFPDGPCAAQLSLPLLPCALGHEPRPHGGGAGNPGPPGQLHRRLWRAGGEVHFDGVWVLPTWQYEVSALELPVPSRTFSRT